MKKSIILGGIEYPDFMSGAIPTGELSSKDFRKLIEARKRHEAAKLLRYKRSQESK